MWVESVNKISPLQLCFVIWQKRDYSGWSWLHQETPLKAEHFFSGWSQRKKTVRHATAGLEEGKLLCCDLPMERSDLQLLTAAPRWQPERNRSLSLTTSESRIWPKTWMCSEVDSSPRGSRKERSLADTWIPADPEQRIQPRCAGTSGLQNCEPINVCYIKLINLWPFVMQQ